MALKTYSSNQKKKTPKEDDREPSGVACTEKHLIDKRWRNCKGEMMIVQPIEEHYAKGRAGEPGAVKTSLKRAVCSECNWKGWV